MNDTMVTLVGNAATAVDHRQTTAGATVARFRLAATSRRWDKALERWTDGETSFYTVRSWRGLADNVAASVAVGEPLIVQGRLRLREGEQSPERGGQRWFAAEVDAVAIGHDLTRGTAAFRRVTRTARTGTDSRAPASPQLLQSPVSPHAAQTQGSPHAARTPGSAQLRQSPGPARPPQQGDRDEALPSGGTVPAKTPTAGGRRESPVVPTANGSRKVLPVAPMAGGSRKPVAPAAAGRPSVAGTPATAGAPPAAESPTITHVPPPLEPPDPSVTPTPAGVDSPEKVAVP